MLLPGDIDLNADEVIEEHVYHGTVKVRLATKKHYQDNTVVALKFNLRPSNFELFLSKFFI